MKSHDSKIAGVTSRKSPKKVVFNIHTIERFYYCVLVSSLFFLKESSSDVSRKPVEVNMHILKWLKIAIKRKTWDKSVHNEILWLKRFISANPLNPETLNIIANVHRSLYQVNTIKKQ